LLGTVPETEHPSTLQQMIAAGRARPPVEHGMPELIPDLAPGLESLADLVVADRDRERAGSFQQADRQVEPLQLPMAPLTAKWNLLQVTGKAETNRRCS